MPDGEFYGPPPNMRCAERLAQKSARSLGIPVIPVRKAMLVGQSRDGPHALPLLRSLHAGLRGRRDLHQRQHAASRRAAHRAPHAALGRAGARNRSRWQWARLRRPLHRSRHQQVRRRAGLGRRRRLRRDRVAAPAAQLPIGPLSQRARQRQRHGRPLSPRPHHPHDVRLPAGAGRAGERQRRRGDRPRDHRALQPPARHARLRRRLHGAAPVRRSGLPAPRQSRGRIRRIVQTTSAGSAARADAAGRLRQGGCAARQPRHGGSGRGPIDTGSRFRSCTSPTATTTARCGAT